jgi:hypothetical protein
MGSDIIVPRYSRDEGNATVFFDTGIYAPKVELLVTLASGISLMTDGAICTDMDLVGDGKIEVWRNFAKPAAEGQLRQSVNGIIDAISSFRRQEAAC